MFVQTDNRIDCYVDGDEVFLNQHQMPLYEIKENLAFGEPLFRVNKRELVTLVDGSIIYIYPCDKMFDTIQECKNYVLSQIQ